MPGRIIKRVYVNKTLNLWLQHGFELDRLYDKQEFLKKLRHMIQRMKESSECLVTTSILVRMYRRIKYSDCKKVRLIWKGRAHRQ